MPDIVSPRPPDKLLGADARSDSSGTANAVAVEARQILLACYTDGPACSTTRIAEEIGVTPSHLCHVYKSTWGDTIGSDLRRLRIGLAKRLLAERALPIKQIAGLVGYERATYRAFFNAFRAETGMPPSDYRRLANRRARAEAHARRQSLSDDRGVEPARRSA